MIPYSSEDYRLDYCREKAEELRESGIYSKVHVIKKRPETINGQKVEYGRIYVEEESS